MDSFEHITIPIQADTMITSITLPIPPTPTRRSHRPLDDYMSEPRQRAVSAASNSPIWKFLNLSRQFESMRARVLIVVVVAFIMVVTDEKPVDIDEFLNFSCQLASIQRIGGRYDFRMYLLVMKFPQDHVSIVLPLM